MPDSKPRRPSTPKGLDRTGRRLWRDVVSAYELRPDELILLDSACRTADLVVRLEAAMEGQPLTVRGSMGQEREHPLLSEARQQRSLLARLFAQLKLPDADAEPVANQQRDAAMARWSAARGAR